MFTDRVWDVPVVQQRQVATVQLDQEAVELHRSSFQDKAVDILVGADGAGLAETLEVPQLQFNDRVVHIYLCGGTPGSKSFKR